MAVRRIPLFSPLFYDIGDVGILMARTLRNLLRRPFERGNFAASMEDVGIMSLPVVSITSAFGGLVFGLQTYIGFHKYVGPGTEVYSGAIIAVGLAKELIPLLVGLMLAGRVGSSIAAQIGTMKITEQVDALVTLGADPNRYLVVPRTLASMIMVPSLILYGDMIGTTCGFLFNTLGMGVNRVMYLRNTLLYITLWDISVGLIKGVVFGFVIAVIGCWQGLKAEGGAEGVGKATTRAMVDASIIIIMLNFFLSKMLPK